MSILSTKYVAAEVGISPNEKGVYLRKGNFEMLIETANIGGLVSQILAIAEQPMTVDEIIQKLARDHQEIGKKLVEAFIARGLLYADSSKPLASIGSPQLNNYYLEFGIKPSEIETKLEQASIKILGINKLATNVASILTEIGVKNIRIYDVPAFRDGKFFSGNNFLKDRWPLALQPELSPQSPIDMSWQVEDIVVAFSESGDVEQIREWNRSCMGSSVKFLPVVLQKCVGYIGPFVVPGETPCYECLRARQNSQLADPEKHRYGEKYAIATQAAMSWHPAMIHYLAGQVALELHKFLVGVTIPGMLIETNFLGGDATRRKVLKIPFCECCSPLHNRSTLDIINPFLSYEKRV